MVKAYFTFLILSDIHCT